MLTVRTPGASQSTRCVAQPAIPPSPLSDRVGYSDHVRFRGYFPVHFIPAYNLPVYASQWPLPDTTQDSVRGCSLGFTAAAISGDRVQRTCTAQRSSNRTCPIKASGFPTGFIIRHTAMGQGARVADAVRQAPRTRVLRRTCACHVRAPCAAGRESAVHGHRRGDRSRDTPASESHS
jgi:hypothetical protein